MNQGNSQNISHVTCVCVCVNVYCECMKSFDDDLVIACDEIVDTPDATTIESAVKKRVLSSLNYFPSNNMPSA